MRAIVLLALLAASSAAAEVKSNTPTGFEVERKAVIKAAPEAVYAQIGRIGEWWDVEHSYSGQTANLRLDLRAGGCLCETFGQGGSIEHMRVIYADPKTGIRMSGGLGPLQAEAVTGTFAWTFKPVEDGTELTQSYRVAGMVSGDIQKLAPLVDQVLGGQFDRLVAKLSR